MSTPIAINGRFVTQRLTGVQRYAIETVRALDALLAARDPQTRPRCELLVPRGHEWQHGALLVITVRKVGRFQGQVWEQLELPYIAHGILLNLCNTYPMFSRQPVVTIHDVAVYAAPSGFTLAFRLFYRLLLFVLRLRRSIPVMTDSTFSANEIARYVRLSPERLVVVPCGADHWSRVTSDAAVLNRLALHNGGFVLGVASENPNKNLARLIKAFGQAYLCGQIPLVLVGGRNSRVFADAGGVDPQWVIRTGHISDAELATLYSSAVCFVFPSLYEGFGIPPLEAMIFGCPVIVSREASLPEVCGDAAEYCDGYDTQNITDSLNRVLGDAELRETLVRRGKIHVSAFQWRASALKVLALIENYP